MCNIFRLINVEQKLFRSQKYRRKDFRLDFNENLKILPGLCILVDGIDTYVHWFILCSMLVQLSSLATLYHKILLLRQKKRTQHLSRFTDMSHKALQRSI